MLRGWPYSEDVVALTDCTILELSKEGCQCPEFATVKETMQKKLDKIAPRTKGKKGAERAPEVVNAELQQAPIQHPLKRPIGDLFKEVFEGLSCFFVVIFQGGV